MFQAITFVSTLLAVILILFIFKNKSEKSFSKFLKILTIIFCVMGFFRFMLSDSFVLVIKGGYFNNKYYDRQDILQSIIRWGYYIGYSVLPMAVFFKNRFFRNIASYLFLPFAILSAVFIDDYMVYFLSPEGFGLHLVPWIRYAYFIVELTLSMAIPIVLQIKEKHVLNVKDKKELIYFFVGIPLIFLQVMPVYIPQSLLGYTGDGIHTPWMIIIAIETIALYYFFRFKNYDTRYQLVIGYTQHAYKRTGNAAATFSVPDVKNKSIKLVKKFIDVLWIAKRFKAQFLYPIHLFLQMFTLRLYCINFNDILIG